MSRRPAPSRRALLAGLGTGLLPWGAPALAAAAAALELDHAWIAVTPGAAAERPALAKLGFRFAPGVNRHVGQGTSSITVEFVNGFLELLWPDDSVPVAPELEAAKAKFVAKSNWRTTGVSPFAVGLHRTPATPTTFPFETWSTQAAWMPPGSALQMLTPRVSRAVSLFIPPEAVDAAANARTMAGGGPKAETFEHPNGARRILGLKLTAPSPEGLPPSADFVRATGAVDLAVGDEWLMQMRLGGGDGRRTADLRPVLPLKLIY